jgi:hypothetical protein
MYACLDRAIKQQSVCISTAQQDLTLILAQAIARFTQLADDSDEVPALQNKKYRGFHLSRPEWEQLKLLHELMKVGFSQFPRSTDAEC